MSRCRTLTQKVETPFSPCYVHIELNSYGHPVGGWISSPGKEPESQISQLIHALSEGLNRALKVGAGEVL